MSELFYGYEDANISPRNNIYPEIKNLRVFFDTLNHVWCAATCAPRMRKDWSLSNMTLGQCSITAFLVQDIFGGEVYGIDLKDGNYHCFNLINSHLFDLTSGQFGKIPDYSLSFRQRREDHFAKEEKYQRYLLLKKLLNDYSIQKGTE